MATELERSGFDLNHPLWSAHLITTNPDALKEVHLAYLKAGADILTTASYQASFEGCEKLGMSGEETEALLTATVEIAEKSRDDFVSRTREAELSDRISPLIAASIGSYGAYLANGAEYTGDYGILKRNLRKFHSKRFEILSKTNADLMICETLPSFEEAEILLEVLKETTDKQAYFSFSCKDDKHISDGTPITECASLLANCEQVSAIGINCTAPKFISRLIEQVKIEAPEKDVIVYPNSGEAYRPETKSWRGVSSGEDFADQAIEWFQKGATIIGGCCRTTPKHVSAIRKSLDSLN